MIVTKQNCIGEKLKSGLNDSLWTADILNRWYLLVQMESVPITGPVVAQRVGRGIALLLHDRGTRRGWVVSSMPWLHFTPGKDPVPIVQEAGWAPGPVWTGGKSRPTGIRSPDRPARSQSLYRLSYQPTVQTQAIANNEVKESVSNNQK